MKKLILAVAMFATMSCSYAQTLKSAHTDGSQMGRDMLSTQSNRVKGDTINGKDSVKDLPFYNANPPQTAGYKSGSVFQLGSDRINSCKGYVPTGDKIADQECAAVNFLAANPNPAKRFDLTNDPAVLAGREHAKNAAGMGNLVNESSCVPKTTTTPAETAIKTCSQSIDAAENKCPVFHVVQKKPQTNYMCDVTFQAKEKATCDRQLNMVCDRPPSCGFGGVVGTPFGDMTTKTTSGANGGYTIEFGVIGDNYWGGDRYNGTAYDRVMTLDLQDVTAVNTFLLTRVSFDDWLLVSVNGTVVYVGPFGGDRLEQPYTYAVSYNKAEGIECRYLNEEGGGYWQCRKRTEDVYDGEGWVPGYQNLSTHGECTDTGDQWKCDGAQRVQTGPSQFYDSAELGKSWDFTLSIDLRPFLKNGQNRIFTRTIVAGWGESYLKFETQMACPLNCKDVWEDHCGAYEGRTK